MPGSTRHGIEAGESALDLAKKVDGSKNLKLIGLMGYSGGASHTHGWEERKQKSQEDLAGLLETVAGAEGGVAGGDRHRRQHRHLQHRQREAGALPNCRPARLSSWTRSTAKSAASRTRRCTAISAPALTVMTTVISRRHPHQCTIDAGNKALLRPTDEVKGRPEVKVENQGAEYGILAWKDSDRDSSWASAWNCTRRTST